MDKVSGRLTVFFEEPFWVGVFERISEGKLSVCKVTFGAEPKDYEIYDFVLKNYYHHFDIYRHNRLADYDINFCKGCRNVILQQSAFKKMMLIE